MQQIKAAIRVFLSDGKTHTIEEVKAEISRLIGGEIDGVFAELHRDTIVSQTITAPNGNTTSWVKAI